MKRKRSRGWVGLNAPRWAGHHVIGNGEGAMMKQFMRALLCLGLLLPLGAKAEIFVFGDSLSDTGNAAAGRNFIAQAEVNLCHPLDIITGTGCGDLFFQETRVSNGPVAVEMLAQRLSSPETELNVKPSLHFFSLIVELIPFRPPDFGTNYAVAGARARIALPELPIKLADVAETPGLGDLNAQIFGFLADFPSAPSDALYVLMIGGNDVIDAVQALLNPSEDPHATIAAAVDAIGDNINLLIGAGARKFLVANSPNIGSIPAIKIGAEEAGVPPALVRGLTTFATIKFNEQLAEHLGQIQVDQPLVEIKQFNLFRFFEGVRFVGKLFGVFENIKDPCFDSGEYRDTGARNFDPDCGVDKFGDFVFFDDLHPTGQVHRIVGKALSRAARKLIDD